MKLIVDANVLFSALIRDGLTAELLISDKLQIFAPEFLFTEFVKLCGNGLLKKLVLSFGGHI